MADLKENQMASRTAAFVRCIDASGNSGKISLDNLFNNVLRYIGPDSGINQGIDKAPMGIYWHGSDIGNGLGYGMLIVIRGNYIVQIDFNNQGKMAFRFSVNEGESYYGWFVSKFASV